MAFIDAAVKEVKTFIDTNRKQEEEHISKIHRNLRSPEGFFPFAPGQTEITAQLEPLDVAYIDGNILVFRNRRPTVETLNTANVKTLKNIFSNEINIVISNIILHHYLPDVTNFYAELGATMPQLRHNRYAAHVEELFHAAGVAAASVANEHIGDRIRSNPNRANAQKFQQNLQNNLIFNTYKRVNLYATYCHYLLDPEISKKAPASPAYHLQATIKLQVNNFAMAAASMVLFGPDLGANSNFLSHLLRNARTTAINNISECSDAGIPCLAAIYDFGMAEIAHLTGDTDADRLINYWRAALYAKALMMSFKPEK